MIQYGGDYNPEQWSLATQHRGRRAHARRPASRWSASASSAGRSWSRVKASTTSAGSTTSSTGCTPAGIKVALATATATPAALADAQAPRDPAACWRTATVLHPGARQAYRRRLAGVPRLRAADDPRRWRSGTGPTRRWRSGTWTTNWAATSRTTSPTTPPPPSAAGSQDALRHGRALNAAWGTAFWSQRYDSFDEVLPPRSAPTYANPTQQLDFARYSSDERLVHYRALRDVLREVTPNVPTTTNLMVSTGHEVDGLLLLGRRPGRHRQRPLLARPRSGGARRARVQRGPGPAGWRAGTRGCSWSTRRQP